MATQTEILKYSHTIGLTGMQGRNFYYPCDTGIGKNSRLYVMSRAYDAEPEALHGTICDIDGEFYGTFGSFGEGEGQLVWPTAVALDNQHRVYVSDEHTHRISIFESSGEFVSSWGVHGSGPGELDGPSGIAFNGAEDLYVVDHQNNRVQKFTKDGRYLASFGEGGSRAGQLDLPWGVTIAASGDVYVADWQNDRILQFSGEGAFVDHYGESGRGDGQFHRPSSVAVDEEGYMYVADWGNERVQVLDPDGGFIVKLRGQATLSKWAEDYFDTEKEELQLREASDLEPFLESFADDPHEESSHVEKYFWAPVTVKLDGQGRLYVTESNRHRIQIFHKT